MYGRAKKTFEKIMAEKFPGLIKNKQQQKKPR